MKSLFVHCVQKISDAVKSLEAIGGIEEPVSFQVYDVHICLFDFL